MDKPGADVNASPELEKEWLDGTVPASAALPPLESVIAQALTRPSTPAPGSKLTSVDPRDIAERVYRLMRDELELARERE